MKLDYQQCTPRNALRILSIDQSSPATIQLACGWYKMSVTNTYGQNVMAVIMPSDSAPGSGVFSGAGTRLSTQGRTASYDEPLKFYVDDSGVQWRVETYGLYVLAVFIETIPAPIDSRVTL